MCRSIMQCGPDTASVDSRGQLSGKCLAWLKYKAVISLHTPKHTLHPPQDTTIA